MTQSPQHKNIPQTQDQLRDRFVADEVEKSLREYHCEVTEPFTVGLDDDWTKVLEVRREDYRHRETGKRGALIYWLKNGDPLIVKMTVNGKTFVWDRSAPTKDWASYNYQSEM